MDALLADSLFLFTLPAAVIVAGGLIVAVCLRRGRSRPLDGSRNPSDPSGPRPQSTATVRDWDWPSREPFIVPLPPDRLRGILTDEAYARLIEAEDDRFVA
jgi:hypothetical protein